MNLFKKVLQIATLALSISLNVAHASTEAIDSLIEKGIINGYADGTFRPENKINRAEFLKIVIASKTSTIAGQNCFSDVHTEWFAKYICYAKENKIVNGYPDNSFKPASNINLVEALKISLSNDLQASAGELWYRPYIKMAREKNYFINIDQTLDHEISRGEAAQLIYNIQNVTTQSNATTPPVLTPILGLFDDEYPTLPPGKWDWDDAANDGANYRNFETNIGTFEALKDSQGIQYGWKLIGNTPNAIDYGGAGAYFEGSPGTDILNLGKNGSIGGFGSGNLGDGPDVLVFDSSHTLDFRTGSSLLGSTNDNDLIIAGCNPNTGTDFDISTTTIHAGSGSDSVFVRDMERSAIDAGNGNGGDTSIIDPTDSDDAVIFKGNMLDFRFFGGNGNDTAVWYVDEVNQSATWLGPNFFGGGGSGDAIWGDAGIDTLVLVIPTDTKIINGTPPQPTGPGELMVAIPQDYPAIIEWDEPVYYDIYARYCIVCGISTTNKKTIFLEYNKKDGTVFTGYFFATDFERLQLGLGENAKVYELDSVNGKATPNPALPKYTPSTQPAEYCL